MTYTKGIELARRFYEEFGKPMLEAEFGEVKDKIATGLVGHGSECFGYDDDISRDHDMEPGFCIWLTDEAEKEFGFKLMRAYSRLPKEYEDLKLKEASLYGTRGRGVHTIWDFYEYYLGMRRLPETNEEWLRIPEFYLAEATNGVVFEDGQGEFTKIREAILNVPDDVWVKRLASAVFDMAQKGQYNYKRCLEHGEKGAAIMCLNDYSEALMKAVFAINKVHMPYYKWSLRAMRDLKRFRESADKIENALEHPLEQEKFIEETSAVIRECLVKDLGVRDTGDYLEGYAYGLNDLIKDGALRNTPVMLF